jgi:ankyrin repeat protein
VRAVILLALGAALLAAAARPPLSEAARNADRDAVRALIGQKADVNAAEADGSTALHWASYRDDVEAADLLLRAGARVNAATDLGVTPLWSACLNRSAAMVRRLLDAGADPNLALTAGETPLMVAARTGSVEIAEMLLAKGAKVKAHAARGQTALMWAAAGKHPDVVRVLLAHGADVRARSDRWNQMMAVPPHGYPEYNRQIPHGSDTALLFAARVGDLESARLLVEAGSDVNDRDAWGLSATVLAAHSGFRELLEFLLDKGADASSGEAGFTALHVAILRRDEKMAAALLAHGADPNAPLRTWTPTRRSSHDYHFDPALVGATPFWLAARFLQPAVMRMLAARGADPRVVHQSDSVGGKGYQHRVEKTNALLAAAGMGGGGSAWVEPPKSKREELMLETMRTAVELGVDVNALNTEGRTALDAVKALGYGRVAEYLMSARAKDARQDP